MGYIDDERMEEGLNLDPMALDDVTCDPDGAQDSDYAAFLKTQQRQRRWWKAERQRPREDVVANLHRKEAPWGLGVLFV